jgi:predicted alpha/beta hydrolase family esterase
MNKPTIVIIPGNGGPHYPNDRSCVWLRDELTRTGYRVVAHDLPDPEGAHMNIWLPYIETEMVRDENTIIVGFSSGAVATLRYLESHKLRGAIVLGCNYTDLGDEAERAAGWYDAPWQWDTIKKNAGWIEQFHSLDDPYIPVSEPRFIHEHIGSVYHEYADRGHFMEEHSPLNVTFPEIIEIITRRTN